MYGIGRSKDRGSVVRQRVPLGGGHILPLGGVTPSAPEKMQGRLATIDSTGRNQRSPLVFRIIQPGERQRSRPAGAPRFAVQRSTIATTIMVLATAQASEVSQRSRAREG